MKFSVITVTFNDLLGLQPTVASIFRQEHRDLEAIVVDGGSSDGTKEWLAHQTDGRLRWLSEQDRGLYDAMNKGLDRAGGDYVIFMNGGDTFADEHVLEKVAEELAGGPLPDLVYGDAVDVTSSGRRLYKSARRYETLWRGMFTQHQAMLFLRTSIGSLRHTLTFRLSADYDFIARFSDRATARGGLSVRRLAMPICCFQLGGRSDQGRVKALREDFAIRRTTMGLWLVTCCCLWVAHLLHLALKRVMPRIMRKVRYEGAA